MVASQTKQSPPNAFQVENMPEKGQPSLTDWRAVCIATAIAALCTVEHHIINIGEWSYMRTLDHDATSNFFGATQSVCRAAHAVFVIVFALIAYRIGGMRIVVLVGRIVALAGCLLYLLVEWAPAHRRYFMLACYVLFTIGFSTIPLQRSYVARVSTQRDRTRAYALYNFSILMAIVVGPVAQLASSSVEYPGYEILPNVRFNVFTTPVWFALLTNLVAIVLVGCCFSEKKAKKTRSTKASLAAALNDDSPVNVSSLLTRTRRLFAAAPFSWPLALLCIFMKMINILTVVIMTVNYTPILTTTFGLTSTEAVRTAALTHLGIGTFAAMLSAAVLCVDVTKVISARYLFLGSIVMKTLMYFLTYPWPAWSHPVAAYNATLDAGCDPAVYAWCESALASSPVALAVAFIVTLGIAFPCGTIMLDSIYSKVLGGIDQNLMQGIILIAEDVPLIIAPLLSSLLYTGYGMGPLWLANGAVMACGALLWLAFCPRLAEYS